MSPSPNEEAIVRLVGAGFARGQLRLASPAPLHADRGNGGAHPALADENRSTLGAA